MSIMDFRRVPEQALPARLQEEELSATYLDKVSGLTKTQAAADFAPVTEYGAKAVGIQALTSKPFGLGAVHAAPPTVTHATTAAFTGQGFDLASGVIRAIHCNPAIFSSGATARWVNHGVGVSGLVSAYNNNYAAWGIQFDLYGNDVIVRWRSSPGANPRYEVFVDGQPIATGGQQTVTGVTVTSGGEYFMRLQFGTVGKRTVTVLMSDMALYEVIVPPTGQLTAPPATDLQYKIACYGASFTSGNDLTAQGLRLGRWPFLMAKTMGVQVLASALPSTGYTVGESFYNDPLRYNAVIQWKPDAIIVEGSGNDDGQPAATVTANAAALFAAFNTGLPGVPVIVIGAMPRGDTGTLITNRATNIAAVKAAADAAPNVIAFIDPIGYTPATTAYTTGAAYAVGARATYLGAVYECVLAVASATAVPERRYWKLLSWFTGTGNVGTPTGDGSRDLLTSADDLHPSAAGQEVIAANIGREARKALIAWANGL